MKPLAAQAVFQETDETRLVNRLSAVAGADLADREVRQLAGGDLSLIQQLDAPAQQEVMALVKPEAVSAEARGELERIVGPTIDYVSIAFLERARIAAKSVARVVDLDRRPIGTGVMVSPVLFMTNYHVTRTPEEALSQLIQFDYELGIDDQPRAITEFRLDPGAFWFTSPQAQLDFTLIAVSRRVSGGGELSQFGSTALRSGDDKHAIGDFVTVVEHPDGRYKQIALRENRVIGRGQAGRTLHYGADTLPGASGSPVFNDGFELVALHHAGGHLNEQKLEDGSLVPEESNEGIRVSAIVAALHDAVASLTVAQRDLVLPALDPQHHGSSLINPAPAPEVVNPPSLSAAAPSSIVARPDADGWVRTTIPVQIAFKVGGGLLAADAVAAPGADALAGLAERNDPPDQHYDGRRGYSASFLSEDLPIPTLPAALRAAAVAPKGNDASDLVLPYLHFSVVQNGVRKMPFFTAVNIDGRRARDINRRTGEVEAAETWYEDPRVPSAQQLGQDFYANQQPRIFDRGHMVRRLDPAWGSRSVAKKGSDDTFHYTNCCPQVSTFNQSARIWQGIEDYALQNARAAEERITVFTGPVFGDDDPEYRAVKVPKAFWKIVARVDSGKLRATGFLASQEDLLRKWLAAPEAFSDWDELGRVEIYQSRIERIEAATGLSFDELRDHDSAPQTEAGPIALESLDNAAW